MRERQELDYDEYAPTYAWSRFAVPWVMAPLETYCESLGEGTAVLEIGCGTGNYVHALAAVRPELTCFGFDLSESMLAEARARGGSVVFRWGDAERDFPFSDRSISLAFAVDVIHHIANLDRFFAEARRLLVPGGHLLIVTDSEETLKRRSLTQFFPEILPVELNRYPSIAELHTRATAAGLARIANERTEGRIPLGREFVRKLEAKCSSAMRFITPEQHAAGMNRVRAAAALGEKWLSCYDVLAYLRPSATV